MKHILKQLAGLAAITAVAVFGSAGVGVAGGSNIMVKAKVTASLTSLPSNTTPILMGTLELEPVKQNEPNYPKLDNSQYPECPRIDYQKYLMGSSQYWLSGYCSATVLVEQHFRSGGRGPWAPIYFLSNNSEFPVAVGGPNPVGSLLDPEGKYWQFGPLKETESSWFVAEFQFGTGTSASNDFCALVDQNADAIRVTGMVRVSNALGTKTEWVVGSTSLPNTCSYALPQRIR